MEKVIGTEMATTRTKAEPARQAYEILHWGFVALPTIAGIDKFTHIVGEEPVRDRERLSDALPPDARVFILQALSGG